jgi:uncharacterized membrane protein YqjE
MPSAAHPLPPFAEPPKRLVRQLLTIGENRLELFMLEVQEEKEHLLHAILLALGMAVFGFLTGLALTVSLVVFFWAVSPIAVLLTLTFLYGAAAWLLYRRFTLLQQNWKTFPATIDQLRKDRACLENCLT